MEYKQLGEMLTTLERKFGVFKDSELSCCGISLAQCQALIEIGRGNNLSLNKLAELINVESSTMSRTVNNLVKNKMVRRDIHPDDRRYVTMSLTESGRKIYEKIDTGMNLYFKKIYNSIPKNKRQHVMEGMQILIEAIGEYECCK